MSLSHRYHDFADLTGNGDVSKDLNEDSGDETKLQFFEEGYQAGWEDAVKAHETARDRVATDFAQNLQDMSFTYHEAYGKLSSAMQPLLSQIITKLLPDLRSKIIGAHVLAQMTDLMRDQSDNAIEIAVSPTNLDTLNEILSVGTNVPFMITAEPALGDGQVYLRVNQEEREIDFDAVTSGISEALDAFFQEIKQES
ncbi:MAG: hypothetical protein WA790_17300 [Sulfitobacter sp.]